MNKYNLSKEESDLLKVAKMNQDRSLLLKREMDSLSYDMDQSIKADNDFLGEIEKRLQINQKNLVTEEYIRESPHAQNVSWESLVNDANERYEDINFEDLLSQEEFKEAYAHISEIDREFENKTGLRKNDYAFLCVAIALQCLRQYVLDPWLKNNRAKSSIHDEEGRKNKAEPGWYYVDTDKILTNRVPFDVQRYGDNNSIQGFLKGADHRLTTLGHDPVLGWFFGTANIMTSTVTRYDFASAHVKCVDNTNKIYALADTMKIFESVIDRVSQNDMDGKIALGCAVLREGIHLKSDIYTKRSLSLPGMGVISLDLGKKIAKYGIDMASVGTEISLSLIINAVISMIHRLYIDEEKEDPKYYEIRTRKILLYSNLIASTSNTIASVLTEDFKMFDLGGLLVSIGRLISDVRFICKVKDEFVERKLNERFEGIKEEVDMLYEKRFDRD